MIFKRIEMNGFKSFADPVSIELTDGITCIVGPNGSGKSNISDAIRWVLGEQSAKMLRGGKMEEVIFSGTQTRRPKGMAEVTIVLDNRDGLFPLDFAEVSISRRMYRSGESEYRINQTPCRLRDVRELIMDTGLGVEGYSIIGQGKIADIVSNKMESRREIFEEAAGIVKYRTKKEESERKLERASGNLDRVNDIIFEIENRIEGLASDKEKAEEFLALRERYRTVEVNILLRNIKGNAQRIEAITQELSELTSRIDAQKEERVSVEELWKAQRMTVEKLEADIEAGHERRGELQRRAHEVSSRSELRRERFSALTRERERLSDELRMLDERREREDAVLREARAKHDQIEAERLRISRELEESIRIAEQCAQRSASAEEDLERCKDRLFELTGEKAAMQAEGDSLIHLKDALGRRADALHSEDQVSETDDRAFSGDLLHTQETFKEKERERGSVQERLAEAKRKRDELSGELLKIEKSYGALEQDAERMRMRRKLLEELESAYEGYGNSVRFLMRRRPDGIIGVVGELLEVPKGLEVAVETALGASLSHIVCEDDNCAKRSIALLKRHEAGRLTFLPLNSLRAGRPGVPQALRNAEGFIGVASDVVRCPAGREVVLDHLLSRVVLCEDLDSATAMAKKHGGVFRFVTRQGDVIRPSGAITGGSLRNKTGDILSRKGEIDELKTSSAAIASEMETTRSKRLDVQDALRELESDIRALLATEQELEKACAVLQSEMQRLTTFVEQAREARKRRSTEREDTQQEMASLEASIEQLVRAKSEIDGQIAHTDAQAGQLANAVEERRKELAAAREEEIRIKVAQSDFAAQVRGSNALLERMDQSVSQILESIRINADAQQRVDDDMERFSDSSETDDAETQHLKQELSMLGNDISAWQEDRKQARLQFDELEQQRSECDDRLYELQQRRHDADVRYAKSEAQAEGLEQRLWEEFELSRAQAQTYATDDFVLSRAVKESRELRARMRDLGDVNPGAIQEYEEVKSRYDFLLEQQEDLSTAIRELTDIIEETDATIRRQFKRSFDAVVEHFESAFTELFGGGHARLSLLDPSMPLESSIEIEAQPPGKKLQNINLLSGGEKAMTAIALMFAVLQAKPTPFCILDEVEAALDDTNIDRFARYLRKFEDTQFALITHQRATMEYADVLYGVTMPEEGISKILSLRLGEFDEGKGGVGS